MEIVVFIECYENTFIIFGSLASIRMQWNCRLSGMDVALISLSEDLADVEQTNG